MQENKNMMHLISCYYYLAHSKAEVAELVRLTEQTSGYGRPVC